MKPEEEEKPTYCPHCQCARFQRALPPLFVLPDDLPAVLIWGRVWAIECAYQARLQGKRLPEGLAGDTYAPVVMGIECCLAFADMEHEGRRGTNDLVQFRQTFLAGFFTRYLTAADDLAQGRIVIDTAWTEQERRAALYLREINRMGLAPEG